MVLWSLAGFFGAGMCRHGVFRIYSRGALNLCIGLPVPIDWINSEGVVSESGNRESGRTEGLLEKAGHCDYQIGYGWFCGMMCEGCMFDWSGVYMAKVVDAPSGLIPTGYVARTWVPWAWAGLSR